MGVDLDRATACGRDAPGGTGSRESSRVGAGGRRAAPVFHWNVSFDSAANLGLAPTNRPCESGYRSSTRPLPSTRVSRSSARVRNETASPSIQISVRSVSPGYAGAVNRTCMVRIRLPS